MWGTRLLQLSSLPMPLCPSSLFPSTAPCVTDQTGANCPLAGLAGDSPSAESVPFSSLEGGAPGCW